MESYDIIANQPVVIDNGSGVVKAGFAGDQIPKYCFPNYVGRPKHVRVMAGALEGDLFIGPKAEVPSMLPCDVGANLLLWGVYFCSMWPRHLE
ncbi:beta-centractin-like, partial [Sceloporus undulatus]|uniref:beta-centractin-like n=1 Tax=Sceloporus undulatus TaxID=8520 RepID=UPI001C4BB94C